MLGAFSWSSLVWFTDFPRKHQCREWWLIGKSRITYYEAKAVDVKHIQYLAYRSACLYSLTPQNLKSDQETRWANIRVKCCRYMHYMVDTHVHFCCSIECIQLEFLYPGLWYTACMIQCWVYSMREMNSVIILQSIGGETVKSQIHSPF